MKRYLLLAGVGFCCVSGAALAAFDCATPPSCDELGYAYEEIDCDGQTTLKCPFDDAKVYCPNPTSPAERCQADGYKTGTLLCYIGQTQASCPYDSSYKKCTGTASTCADMGMYNAENVKSCDCEFGALKVENPRYVEGFCYKCGTKLECNPPTAGDPSSGVATLKPCFVCNPEFANTQ